MAEEQQNTPQAEGNSESNPSTQADKNDVPYTRFQEVVGQKNQFKSQIEELQTELQKVNAQQEEQRQETLKKNSEFETLYNETNSELAKYKEQNKALTTDLGAFRQGLVEQLPEGRRVYTEGMNMATLQKFVQDEQVAVNANKADSSRAGTTAKGEFGGYGSIEEWASKDPLGCEQHLNKNVTGFSWGNINKK
jgi:DNA-binding protein H-NS